MEEIKKMEISVKPVDQQDLRAFYVTINDKFYIDTSYVFQDRCYYEGWYYKDQGLRDWIRSIRKLYTNKNNRNLYVALCAQTSLNYAMGTFKKGSKKNEPYELLQLCVGNHCLVHELSAINGVHKVLKDFFYNKNTIVMGVGIEKVTAKLQKDFGIVFNKWVELRDLATEANTGLEEKDLWRADVVALARAVSGGEMNYVRPRSIDWWEGRDDSEPAWYGSKSYRPDPRDLYWHDYFLTYEMLKHATVEAFLVQHIATVLLKKD